MKTKHNLPFESCDWPRDPSIQLFRIGTCEGQWLCIDVAYCILSVVNNSPGNGHLEDVFQWFESSCKRDGKAFMILDFMNNRFKEHCISKRGFTAIPGTDNVVKIFATSTYVQPCIL